MRSFSFLIFFIITAITGCTNAETGKGKDVNTESIYFDYKIWGTEEDSNANCVLQYKFGGQNGTALFIADRGKVEIDGTVLHGDSSRFLGAYYELIEPIKEFTGKHLIVFTSPDKTQFKEEFEYHPFGLFAELPEKIERHSFTIRLKDLSAKQTSLRLVMVDTAFATNDVNEIVEITNSEIKINEEMLSHLKNGPISLELYSEEERSLKNHTKEGGKLSISYGLKRQFELVD